VLLFGISTLFEYFSLINIKYLGTNYSGKIIPFSLFIFTTPITKIKFSLARVGSYVNWGTGC
jgi:hypothetical protein